MYEIIDTWCTGRSPPIYVGLRCHLLFRSPKPQGTAQALRCVGHASQRYKT